MAYTVYNYKTKTEMKKAVARGEKVAVYQPGMFGPGVKNGDVSIEGPHAPKPHRWYARVSVKLGVIEKVLS